MNDQQIRQNAEPQPYRHQGTAGVDPAYARLVVQLGGLREIIDYFKSQLEAFRGRMPGSGGLARSLLKLDCCLEELLPLWTPAKHRELTESFGYGHFEAMDWLRRFDPANATPANASSLARRTLSFARQNSDGQPDWNDSVIELLQKRRVRRYFHGNHLRLVHTYRWTVKRAKAAEAEWHVKEYGSLNGPVSVPIGRPRTRKPRRER